MPKVDKMKSQNDGCYLLILGDTRKDMFIHLRQQGKRYEEVKMEDGMFEVQDQVLIFDEKCIISVSDVVKKIEDTFKASIIYLYSEHEHQLKPEDIVEKGRVYTFRRKPKHTRYKVPRRSREEILDPTSLARVAAEYPPF